MGLGLIASGSARREERMKRLSMLFPDTDVDKRRNEERLQMLKVRFVEEVTEQTSVDTQKTNIIHRSFTFHSLVML